MAKFATPSWLLAPEWGVGTDPYNWILYRRSTKKDGSPGNWKAVGYYATADKLLMGFYRKLTRTEDPNSDLVKHVKACSERVQVAAAALSAELEQCTWLGLTPPQRTRKQKARARRALCSFAEDDQLHGSN